jgi:hypothetical protein
MRAFFACDRAPAPPEGLNVRMERAIRAEKNAMILGWAWSATRRLAIAAGLLAALTIGLFIADTGPVHAVDKDMEIHYEDLFQVADPADEALWDILRRTDDPRIAYRLYLEDRSE